MTEQEQARERATRELARRAAAISSIADPYAWAAEFIRDMTTPNRRGRWCYVLADPGLHLEPPNPEAAKRGAADARARLNRKDQP